MRKNWDATLKKKTVIKYKEKHKVWNLHIDSYLAGSILAGSHANLIFIFSKKPKGGSQASQNRGGVRWKSDPAGAGKRVVVHLDSLIFYQDFTLDPEDFCFI